MTKKTAIILCYLIVLMLFALTGCNYQVFDTTYNYDYAIIEMPTGEIIKGEIDKWTDYEGEQLQIVIDGVTYLTHAENVVMVKK